MMMWYLVCLLLPAMMASAFTPQDSYGLTDAFLRNIIMKMKESETPDYLEEFLPPRLGEDDLLRQFTDEFPERVAKNEDEANTDYLTLPGSNPMIRDQEYLQHSSLWGHQYMAGGAGEGKQHLTPSGDLNNSPQVKSDAVLPAYCNPPNPCPKGYTAEQGCLEEFENTAAFSREYQASQDCMCDTEHMFDCPASNRDSQISALARSMQNDGMSANDISQIMGDVNMTPHKSLVAKKFHMKKATNPYLEGEKLPIAAKKGRKVQ